MNKRYLLPLLLIIYSFAIQSQTLTIDGVTYDVDTLENHQIGPGTQYVSYRLQKAADRMDVFMLKTDLKNPYIQIKTALGQDSIYSGERTSSVAKRKSKEGEFYFAGTNGDFYATTGYIGYPVAGNMVESQIAKIPNARNVFVMDDNKIPNTGIVSFDGILRKGEDEIKINGVNHLRGTNELILYNEHNGKYTRTNQYGTELLIDLVDSSWGTNKTLTAEVVSKEVGKGAMAIPKGKAVLSGNGTANTWLNNIEVGDLLEITLGMTLNDDNTANYTLMTGSDGYAPMLKDGKIETANVWAERHPRTGIGYSKDNDSIIFCVVDGRSASVGATTKQLAEIMKTGGAWTAINMDGGGSSTMFVDEYGGPVNRTSDGNERAVANSIFVVSTAPTDENIAIIKPYDFSRTLPFLAEYTPQFYAYNQYEKLLVSDLKGVKLSCPSDLGRIEGNKFIASGSGSGSGQITATYNGDIVTTINISLLPIQDVAIRLDSVIVDNRNNYPIEVIAQTATGSFNISPQALNWSVEDETICKVENGEVVALANGVTTITGVVDNFEGSIDIHIEIPEKAEITGNAMLTDDWKMTASSFLNAKWNSENLPENWTSGAAVNFTHAAGRTPSIKLTNKFSLYGLPDTLKLHMNIGDMKIERAVFSVRENNASKATAFTIYDFVENQDFSLDIPFDQIFDVADKAIYPINFEEVIFYLDAGKMTANKDYTMAIREVALSYKDFVISNVIGQKSDIFSLFPNPVVDGELFIQMKDSGNEEIQINVFDLGGKSIINSNLKLNGANQSKLSLKALSAGIYFVQVIAGNEKSTQKIIVK